MCLYRERPQCTFEVSRIVPSSRDSTTSIGHDVLFVFGCHIKHPYKQLRLTTDRDLNLKTCFLLALALTKHISEFHGLSYKVEHWNSCTFSFALKFIAEIQNLSVPDLCFEIFFILSLESFMCRDRDEMLLFLVRTIRLSSKKVK